jgi:hypothetical protein
LVEELLAAPGNAGIASAARCVPVPADDIPGITALVERERIDLTVVGPEAPLVAGVVDQFRARGLPSAWSWDGCPIVNSGPASEPGHAAPREDILIEPGHLVHIDLGVKHEGYCSDLQRMWYVRRPGEDGRGDPLAGGRPGGHDGGPPQPPGPDGGSPRAPGLRPCGLTPHYG